MMHKFTIKREPGGGGARGGGGGGVGSEGFE
jgi:hypothetical protein